MLIFVTKSFDRIQNIYNLKVFPHGILIIYKSKIVTLQWRNVTDTIFTR